MAGTLVKATQVTPEIEGPRPSERWCVVTEANVALVVDYAGNGGFGPVNVWHEGTLVGLKYRHRFGWQAAGKCATCDGVATVEP